MTVPRWIFYYGSALALIGVVTGLIGVFAPTQFFNDFPDFAQWAEIDFVTNSFGIRNFAMGIAMIVALWLGAPGAIGAVFMMRFVTELFDLLNSFATGHGTMDLPLMVLGAVWVLILLIPEALAARWGFKHA